MVADGKAEYISLLIFTRALPVLRVTLSVGTGAVFPFLVGAATRCSCLCVSLLVMTSSVGTCV